MGHDSHYLSRLDRLGRAHTELALALYRDHERVGYILHYLDLPEHVERVAISLDDPELGPFLIVARNGRFVTCLGAGMRVREDQVVVTRSALEALSVRVDAVRSLLAEAAHSDQHETTRLCRRLLESGDRLTREEHLAVARWMPLLGDSLYQGLMHSLDRGSRAYELLRKLKRPEAADEGLLELYWREAWTSAHLALLLGSDDGMTLKRLWGLRDFQEELGEAGVLMSGQIPFLYGVTSIAARGAWLDAFMAEHTLAPLERAYSASEWPDSTVAHGLSLHAVGMRDGRQRARVAKALGRKTSSTFAPTIAARALVQRCTLEGSASLADGKAALLRAGRDALTLLARTTPARYPFVAEPEALPDDVIGAYALTLPFGLDEQGGGVEHLATWMPYVASLEPSQLYVPDAYLQRKANRWEADATLRMLEERLRVDAWSQPQPMRAEARPGRNDPCSCGSGKKYKRCCGASASGA